MGERTGISWCHHTFNPWWGCIEVSPECDNCYARDLAKRFGHLVWGKDAPRRFFPGAAHWTDVLKWNREAEKAGERRRVFCASMCDVMERRDDVVEWRERTWELIEQTQHLDWLLLTKRPQEYRNFLPKVWLDLPRANVWLGVTVGVPESLWRVDELRNTPGEILWVSNEPALAFVDFAPYLNGQEDHGTPLSGARTVGGCTKWTPPINWIVTGGESGHGCRPMDLAWARKTRDQCKAAGVSWFMKQLGGYPKSRAELADFPEDLRIQQFPVAEG